MRWASIGLGLCLVGGTLVVTSYEQQRPSVSAGSLATAATGSGCTSPPAAVVHQLRATYTAGMPGTQAPTTRPEQVLAIGDSTTCTLLSGLQAVGPSYGLDFQNGAVIGCGIVSGTIAPLYDSAGQNLSAFTDKCAADAEAAETAALQRYHPGLVVWGSTQEHNSIVVPTPTGTKVLVTGTPEWRTVMRQKIDHRVQQLLLATGAKVILLEEPPSVHAGGPPAPTPTMPSTST